VTAAKLYRRVVRQLCKTYLEEKQPTDCQAMLTHGIDEDDLFIDMKLDYTNKLNNYSQMFFQQKPTEKKGREFETMPYFLSDQFKALVEDKSKPKTMVSSESKNSLQGGAFGGNSLYKSDYLKEKMVEQQEKKRRDRKNKKPG
jgi:hypothetical protein